MKKILFVAQNLQIGGVQRALVNMLDFMSPGDDVRLFVFGNGPLAVEKAVLFATATWAF